MPLYLAEACFKYNLSGRIRLTMRLESEVKDKPYRLWQISRTFEDLFFGGT